MPCKDSEDKSEDWPAFIQMGGSMDLGSLAFKIRILKKRL